MSSETARVEIDIHTLQRLLRDNQVVASEVKCLDAGSKKLLWKLCLNACRSHKATADADDS